MTDRATIQGDGLKKPRNIEQIVQHTLRDLPAAFAIGISAVGDYCEVVLATDPVYVERHGLIPTHTRPLIFTGPTWQTDLLADLLALVHDLEQLDATLTAPTPA